MGVWGDRLPRPTVQQETLPNTSYSLGAAPSHGGGGGCVAAGSGGLTTSARRDAGTMSQSGEGSDRVNRHGPGPRGRCSGLSDAGNNAEAGLARPNQDESALAPACGASGASSCRPRALPRWGGHLSRRPVPLMPRAAASAESPAQLQAAAAQWRGGRGK